MHLIKDENGNLCPHTHDHVHTHTHDGVTHTHAHSHAHGHEDDHNHEHTHGEDASCGKESCGECQGCGQEDPVAKNAALLTYMYQHNQSHAAELDQMAAKLSSEGMEKAAEQIRKAVDEFQKGNMYLNLALSMLHQ